MERLAVFHVESDRWIGFPSPHFPRQPILERPEGTGGRQHVAREENVKAKSRACAVPLLGAAGLSLSMVSGSPAATVGPTAHEITLGEEEISDVSLATFYVFDKENVGASERGVQLVGHRGPHGCHAHRGCKAATEAARLS